MQYSSSKGNYLSFVSGSAQVLLKQEIKPNTIYNKVKTIIIYK